MEEKPVETNAQREIREELGKKADEKADPSFANPPEMAIDSDKYNITNMALMDFLGIKSEDWESNRDKLSVVREWAEITSRSKEKVEILQALKYLEDNVVSRGVTDDRLKSLYRWIRLDLDTKRIEKEKGLYEQ